MDYARYVRMLELPTRFEAPATLRHDGLVAQALTRAHLADDVRGINRSLDLIRRTRGGGWPTEPVTEAFNFVDLVWHEQEFREGTSFAYAVYDEGGAYFGCCYLYPMGRRTPLAEALLDRDVDVSWWVTPEAHARGDYQRLHQALQRWVRDPFPFRAPWFSNAEIPAG